MTIYHKHLSQEKWNNLDKSHQILNIATELSRARNCLRLNVDYLKISIERALELIDLTVNDRSKWQGNRLREILRFRDVLAGYYIKDDKSARELDRMLSVILSFDRISSTVRFA